MVKTPYRTACPPPPEPKPPLFKYGKRMRKIVKFGLDMLIGTVVLSAGVVIMAAYVWLWRYREGVATAITVGMVALTVVGLVLRQAHLDARDKEP